MQVNGAILFLVTIIGFANNKSFPTNYTSDFLA